MEQKSKTETNVKLLKNTQPNQKKAMEEIRLMKSRLEKRIIKHLKSIAFCTLADFITLGFNNKLSLKPTSEWPKGGLESISVSYGQDGNLTSVSIKRFDPIEAIGLLSKFLGLLGRED